MPTRTLDLILCLALYYPRAMAFELWLDLRGSTRVPALSSDALSIFDRQLVPVGDEDLAVSGPAVLQTRDTGQLLAAEAIVGAAVAVGTGDAQQGALALVGSVEWILAETAGGAPMITAENLLAAAEGTPTRLAVPAAVASEVNGLAFALDRGVDALVVRVAPLLDGVEGTALLESLQIAKAQRLERAAASEAGAEADAGGGASEEATEVLLPARLTAVVNGGVADRVCLDFTRLLAEGEGCLLGSSAKLLTLVLGETAPSGYVPPRPFRVNAGPVHQYVLMAEPPGATKYLSEVNAGDVVLAVDAASGRSRGVTVGRAKTEPRPMLRIDFALEDDESAAGQLFLQQAETVRLATVGEPADQPGAALPVTVAATESSASAVLPRVRVRSSARGTHVGKTIAARVNER